MPVFNGGGPRVKFSAADIKTCISKACQRKLPVTGKTMGRPARGLPPLPFSHSTHCGNDRSHVSMSAKLRHEIVHRVSRHDAMPCITSNSDLFIQCKRSVGEHRIKLCRVKVQCLTIYACEPIRSSLHVQPQAGRRSCQHQVHLHLHRQFFALKRRRRSPESRISLARLWRQPFEYRAGQICYEATVLGIGSQPTRSALKMRILALMQASLGRVAFRFLVTGFV